MSNLFFFLILYHFLWNDSFEEKPFFSSQTHDFAAQNPDKCWLMSLEAET